jgi:hypothetical protein
MFVTVTPVPVHVAVLEHLLLHEGAAQVQVVARDPGARRVVVGVDHAEEVLGRERLGAAPLGAQLVDEALGVGAGVQAVCASRLLQDVGDGS